VINVNQGLLRIARVARWTGAFLAFAALAMTVDSLWDFYRYGSWEELALAAILPVLQSMAFFLAAFALAWIIEGFAQSR